ncbi:MAG: hypothetical protein JNK05_33990 [Myxococcales bacterium]|nr:hypothetical protein [Myxococcales bacterium]
MLDELDVREDFDPDEVRRALLKIVEHVALCGRLAGWNGHSQQAGDLFDHIHNLPRLAEAPTTHDLVWFWNNYAWHFDETPSAYEGGGYRMLFDAIATPRAKSLVRAKSPDDEKRRRWRLGRSRFAASLSRFRRALIAYGIAVGLLLGWPIRSAFVAVYRAAPPNALFLVALYVSGTLGLFSLALALGRVVAKVEPPHPP